ncbi:MAG TPA: flagellar motor switch phosphatase FliY [Firmicutes bacterium]|jgi:flagellar motor switch protein FliN/FliY|nr:flagellar motor switch phosphatase FliY [Bacillota bacterium]
MANEMLSQEEINALLKEDEVELSPLERDALGEIGNIAFGSGSTALSLLLNRRVELNTPTVELSDIGELVRKYPKPCIAAEVDYKSGLRGTNLLMIQMHDGAVIADLMLGGDGTKPNKELGEMEMSAIGEAMNQMIGKASTSMSSLFNLRVEIAPPRTRVLEMNNIEEFSNQIAKDNLVAVIYFRLLIENLVDSKLMLVIPYAFAREMANTLIDKGETAPPESKKVETAQTSARQPAARGETRDPDSVRPIQFNVLNSTVNHEQAGNLNLLLDVPLQISVELGSTRMRIKEILDLGIGSVIELDRLAGEQVDILVNGKLIAKGEVVVIDENFGVKITDIISPFERVNNLQ